MTNVYITRTGRRIEPFGDPVSEIPLHNRPLGEHLDEAIAGAGLTRIDELRPPCLVVPDALFTTAGALRRFVDGARGRNAVLVLGESLFARKTVPVQPQVTEVPGNGYRFESIRFVGHGEAAPVDVVVDPEEEQHTINLPGRYVDEDPVVSLPRHPVITIHHWVHILWATQAASSALVRAAPIGLGLRVAFAVLRARSANKWAVLGKLNRIGKGCDIHPTALIEGSILEDGVTVGPFARILFSRVGKGALVLGGALVEASVLGPRTTVSQSSCLRMSVLFEGAIASAPVMQAAVIGRRAFTTSAFWPMDLNLERTVRVPLDGELHDTKTHFVGAAVGHDARIGAGVYIAPGRAIPCGTFIASHPAQVLSRVPTTTNDGVQVVVDGGLQARDHVVAVAVSRATRET